MITGGCVYIISNRYKTTLYVGVTSDLIKRIQEHQNKVFIKSFSAKYNLNLLLYYETYPTLNEAILREKEFKKWHRSKKEKLINSKNPTWSDLWEKEVKFW